MPSQKAREVQIPHALIDISKINGKEVLILEQTDNKGRPLVVYVNNFKVVDWRKEQDKGEMLARSSNNVK